MMYVKCPTWCLAQIQLSQRLSFFSTFLWGPNEVEINIVNLTKALLSFHVLLWTFTEPLFCLTKEIKTYGLVGKRWKNIFGTQTLGFIYLLQHLQTVDNIYHVWNTLHVFKLQCLNQKICLPFSDWLISPIIIPSRSIHAVAKGKLSFFFTPSSNPLCKCTTAFLSTHLLIGRWAASKYHMISFIRGI